MSATKKGRIKVLQAFLDTPEVIAAMARGSGYTEVQMRIMIHRLIRDLQETPE